MSMCMCARCDRFEDTDYDIGEWDDDSPYDYTCSRCVEHIEDEYGEFATERINGETFAQFVKRMEADAPQDDDAAALARGGVVV